MGTAYFIICVFNLEALTCAEKQIALANVVPAIEKARLYRGKGGEIMRGAVSRFIECESLAQIPLELNSQRKSILDTINENLRHPNSQIQVNSSPLLLMHFVYFAPLEKLNKSLFEDLLCNVTYDVFCNLYLHL